MSSDDENSLVVDLLRRISDALANNDHVYLRDLHKVPLKRQSGESASPKRIKYLTFGNKKEKVSEPTYPTSEEMYSEKIVDENFYNFKTIEDLSNFIKEKYPKKIDVLLLARALQVPAPKADDYETMVTKIANATLGFRLRSLAVRGRDQQIEKETEKEK